MAQLLWTPSAERVAGTGLTRFIEREVRGRWNADPSDYAELHRWSITEKERFWQSVWSFGDVIGDGPGDDILRDSGGMRDARWFPGARLNFAENLLRRRDGAEALVFRGEDRVARALTFGELHDLVSRLVRALEAAGVKEGDRVAGYLPNIPEAIAAMLAAASIGATWSSCSPDFGPAGVVDRFGQIEPKVLFCTDGYYYNGKWIDMLPRTAEALERLPSVTERIVIAYGGGAADPSPLPGARSLDDFVSAFAPGEIAFRRLPFNHPLYILFSSGTTGVPKCIVHGAGGTLLQHLKEHRLHSDIGAGDRAFYFTTLGWMMWNWLVSGLASGATLLLYDGSPFHPGPEALFDFADAAGMTHFGTSAKYIDAIKNEGLEPIRTHELAALRGMMSTGSPLVEESFDYVYRSIKPDICLSSISGGTDIVSCFVLGNPNGPVRRGEIQAFGLGMDVQVYDASGRPVIEEKGELVCASPFPSMPVMFWNDPDGDKYHNAYFARFENVWCHGDYAEVTASGGMKIYGRSDAVLNPGGVRIGTAEIYRQVEQMPEIEEALAIGQEWEGDARVILFVRLSANAVLDDDLDGRIRKRLRNHCSPRHVPAHILAVADIPRTKSGKITELAVRDVVHGREVRNVEALANPEALEHFRERQELTV